MRAPCVVPPPKVSTLPHAQVSSTTGTELTVSSPGKAGVFVRDPRPLRPPARKTKEVETQAVVVDVVILKCYGAYTYATPSTHALCDGS